MVEGKSFAKSRIIYEDNCEGHHWRLVQGLGTVKGIGTNCKFGDVVKVVIERKLLEVQLMVQFKVQRSTNSIDHFAGKSRSMQPEPSNSDISTEHTSCSTRRGGRWHRRRQPR